MSQHFPRVCAFLKQRFARRQYLGLHLTIGFAICLAGLWVLAGITEDVVTRDAITRFDPMLLEWLRAHSTPLGDRVFSAISLLGSPLAMAIIALAVGIWLIMQREWTVLAVWLIAMVGGQVLAMAFKLVIQRPRPPGAAAFLHNMSWSFPSGHAMGSLIGYGMLSYLAIILWVHRRGWQIAIAVGAIVLVLLIGLSRLYLGVHYFSDVMAGYSGAVLWLSACISALEVVRRRGQLRGASV
jgi:undecaprenyl-diphosphatase